MGLLEKIFGDLNEKEVKKQMAILGELNNKAAQEILANEEYYIQDAQKRAKKSQMLEWQNSGLCPFCGGEFKGLITKRCSVCGRKNEYHNIY